jgi:hypothetical protein
VDNCLFKADFPGCAAGDLRGTSLPVKGIPAVLQAVPATG